MKKISPCCMLLICFLGYCAQAATWTDSSTGYTWTYQIHGNTSEIFNNYKVAISPSPKGDITIPSELGGKPVTRIGDHAFDVCNEVISVTIPNGVLSIGAVTFRGCRGLRHITIPNSVTNIGSWTFCGCSALSDVVLPSNMVRLEENLFSWCDSLTAIDIPPSVTCIEPEVFRYCYGLKEISLPQGISTIADSTFHNCSSLTNVVLPVGLTSIGTNVFAQCPNLKSVTLPSGVTRIGATSFSGCRSMTSLSIPASLTNIGVDAFSGCTSLQSIEVDVANPMYKSQNNFLLSKDGKNIIVVPLGRADISIPEGVQNIPDRMFSNNSSLRSIVLPSSVANIGNYAFSGCSGLTNLVISANVTSIGSNAFQSCTSIRSIEVDSGNPVYKSQDGLLMTKDGKNLILAESDLVDLAIPEGVEFIANYAFQNRTALRSVILPSSVTNVGNYAFSGCSGITNLVLSTGLKSIGNRAFASCRQLKELFIPSSVATIGDYAFYNCYALTNAVLSWGVESIGNSSFYYCDRLLAITIPSSVKHVGINAFQYCSNSLYDNATISGVRLVDGWAIGTSGTVSGEMDLTGSRGIATSAFRNCADITSVFVPPEVSGIGLGAFSNCTSLATAYIPTTFAGSIDGRFETAVSIVRYKPVQTVVLNANGGTVTPSSIEVSYRGQYGKLPIPTRYGHSFGGWTLNGNLVSADTAVEELDDHALVAVWQANPSYTVTFDADGGTGGTSYVRYYGTTIGTLPIPSRNGYEFIGWFTEANGGTLVTEETVIDGDKTFYANWGVPLADALDNHDLTFETNEGGAWFGKVTADSMIGEGAATPLVLDCSHVNSDGDVLLYSSLQTTIIGPGKISFWWKIDDSSFNLSDFSFYCDNMPGFLYRQDTYITSDMNIFPSTEWTEVTLDVPSGTHKIWWDVSAWDCSYGEAWLDGIVWTPDDGMVDFEIDWPSGLASASYRLGDGTNCVLGTAGGTMTIRAVPGATITLTGTLGYATQTVTGSIVDNGVLSLPTVGFNYYFPMTATAGQDGTSTHPYEIADANGLKALAAAVEAGYGANLCYVQTADIDMSSAGVFAGVGTYAMNLNDGVAFTGTYDGGGHKISNVDITQRNYGGIFNQVRGGTISNLTVSNITCSAFSASANDGEWGCAIVGNAGFGATLRNLVAEGTFGTAAIPCSHNVAGIAVRVCGGASNVVSGVMRVETLVKDCTNNATLYGFYTKAAGITALTQDPNNAVPNDYVLYDGCVNNADIALVQPAGSNLSKIGSDGLSGIVGYVDDGTKMRNCANNGTLTSPLATASIGGLVGWAKGRFKDLLEDLGGNANVADKPMVGVYDGSVVAGFQYATIADGVATTTRTLAKDTVYLLEGNVAASETPVFSFDTAGTLTFDTALGYTFAGTVDAAANLTITTTRVGAMVTFTACVNRNTIIFDANGGVVSPTSKEVTYGSTIGTLPIPTREGYEFVGWYNGDGSHVSASTTVYGNITLTARWNVLLGTALDNTDLVFTTGGNANWFGQEDTLYDGGDAARSGPITHNQSTWLQTTVTGPARFSFWWKVSSESSYDMLKVYLDDSEAYSISGEVDWQQKTIDVLSGTHVIRWTYSKDSSVDNGQDCGWVDQVVMTPLYTATFDANGGSGGTSMMLECGETLVAPTVTRTGYTFTGWSPGVPATMPAEDVTYTAQWEVRQYTMTFAANGGTGGTSMTLDYGTPLTAPTVTRDGYTFTGWSPTVPSYVPASNRTYTAQWQINRYLVTFDANGGTGEWSRYMDYGASIFEPSVTREGHTFQGWWPDDVATTVPNHDLTYYAQWSVNYYTVNFYDSYGYSQCETVAYGDTLWHFPTPSAPGPRYHFRGWFDSQGNLVSEGVTVFSNMALYAQWDRTPPREFTVTLDPNGGTISQNTITVDEDNNTIWSLPNPERLPNMGGDRRTDYYFQGWGVSCPFSVNDDITLTANWLYREYCRVAFDANGGMLYGTNYVANFEEVGTVVYLPTPIRAEYVFEGWYEDRYGYSRVESEYLTVYNPIALYAGWDCLWDFTRTGNVISLNRRKLEAYGEITVPETIDGYPVTCLGAGVFRDCGDITSIAIPASVTNITEGAFFGCSNLVSITVATNNPAYASVDGVLYDKQGTAILCHPAGKMPIAAVSNTVVCVGGYAFAGCSGLSDVELSTSVTNIGPYAFAYCENLDRAVLPKPLEPMCNTAFVGCPNWLEIVYYAIVSFNAGGADGEPPADRRIDCGEEIGELPDPTKEGYAFFGWRDGDGNAITAGTIVEENMTCYAFWRRCYSLDEALGEGAWTSGTNGVGAANGYSDTTASGGKSVFITAEDASESWIELSVPGPGEITFDWKVSSEKYKAKIGDYASFTVDGVEMAWIIGEVDWSTTNFLVEADGPHVFRWTYVKNASKSTGDDCTWVANVRFKRLVQASFADGGATGGSVPEALPVRFEGEEVMLPGPGNLVKACHGFAGWSDGTSTYSAGDRYCLPQTNMTFVAMWTAKVVATPVIVAPTWYTDESTEVSISCSTIGAEIHYTLDGTEPTAESLLYVEPFSIDRTVTVRAVALADDWFASSEAIATAERAPWTAAECLNSPEMAFAFGGDGGVWTRDMEETHDGVASLRSAPIGDMQATYVEMVVTNAGIISFWWKVSSEFYSEEYPIDGASFTVDGREYAWRDGLLGWTNVFVVVEGNGPHTLRWTYIKDEDCSVESDCVWLDEVKWITNAYIQVDGKTTVGIPGEWFITHAMSFIAVSGGNVTAALESIAANGKRSVAECYMLGVDPEDPVDDFTITSFEMRNGEPVFTFSHEMDGSGNSFVPRIRTLGTTDLSSEWQTVPKGGNPAFRFFKVVVELP